jgi:cell wall assembly regulator SMI1
MSKKDVKNTLEVLLPRLYALLVELDAIEEPSPQDRVLPFAPAPPSDIVAAEQRLGVRFPPSYRAFLTMHNGWRTFPFDWSAVGVSGPGWERASKVWERECARFEKHCQRKRPNFVRELREKSRSDPSIMYWPDHVPVAMDFNGGFRVLDRNRLTPDGEHEVAEVNAGSEEAINRLPSFLAVVERAMNIARRELVTHGRRPADIEATATAELLRTAAASVTKPGAKTGSRKSAGKSKISKKTAGAPRSKSVKATKPTGRANGTRGAKSRKARKR